MLTFLGKYLINTKLVCETGLHIGGATEGFEIGGIDNPVIKDALTDEPYIPGSSLKGKLRSLLEWYLGDNKFTGAPHHFTQKGTSFNPCSCGQCVSCALFGVTPDTGVKSEEKLKSTDGSFAIKVKLEGENKAYYITGPSRLIVRDSFLTDNAPKKPDDYKTKTEVQQLLGQKNLFTEIKTENALDRVTAEANPRPMERVPKGAAFDIDLVFNIYSKNDKEILRNLFIAMHLLEDSALGGTISRGSGKVRFTQFSARFRPVSYYETGDESKEKRIDGLPDTVSCIIKNFDQYFFKLDK